MGSGNNENGHDINEIIDEIFLAGPVRIIISKPADKEAEFRKVTITAKKSGYQIEKLTQKQAFHENVLFAQADILKKRCAEWLTGE